MVATPTIAEISGRLMVVWVFSLKLLSHFERAFLAPAPIYVLIRVLVQIRIGL
jgi:hypothetical protein